MTTDSTRRRLIRRSSSWCLMDIQWTANSRYRVPCTRFTHPDVHISIFQTTITGSFLGQLSPFVQHSATRRSSVCWANARIQNSISFDRIICFQIVLTACLQKSIFIPRKEIIKVWHLCHKSGLFNSFLFYVLPKERQNHVLSQI